MFLPALGAITVFILDAIFTSAINLADPSFRLANIGNDIDIPTFAKFATDPEIIATEFKNRLLYYFSELTVTFFFITTIFVSCIFIHASLAEADISRPRLAFLLILVPGIVLFYVNSQTYRSYALIENLLSTLEKYSQVNVQMINRLQSGISIFAIFLLISAFCAVLIKTDGDNSRIIEHLRIQRKRLMVLLYLGASLLVAGVAAIYFADRWIASLPSQMFISGNYAKAMTEIVNAHTSVKGFFYTMLLLSMYVPATYIFELRGDSIYYLENPAGTPEHRTQWLKENGVFISLKESFANITILFAPVMAGLSSTAIETLKAALF